MKKIIYTQAMLLLLLLCGNSINAQTKFGDNKATIQPGSLVEMESTNKGLLLPRLTGVQMNAIPVTALSNGMMVYNTDSTCICQYNGTAWRSLCGVGAYTEPWYDKVTKAGATLNTQDIYQKGRVHVGTEYTDFFEAYQPKAAIKGTADNLNGLLVYDTLTANPTVPQNALQSNLLALNTGNAAASHAGGIAVSVNNNYLNTITPYQSNVPVIVSANVGIDIKGTMNSDYQTQVNLSQIGALTTPRLYGMTNALSTSSETSVTDKQMGIDNNIYNEGTIKRAVGIDNDMANNGTTTIADGAAGITNNLNNNTSGTIGSVFGVDTRVFNSTTTNVPGSSYGNYTELQSHSTANGGGTYGNYTRMQVTGTGSTQTGFFRPGIIGGANEVTVSNGGGDAFASRNTVNVTAGTRTNVVGEENVATYAGTTNVRGVTGVAASASFNSDAELNPVSDPFNFFGGLYGVNSQVGLSGAGPIGVNANVTGIRNAVTSSRTAATVAPITGLRNDVYTGPSATGQHNMGIGITTYVGRFNTAPVYFDTAVGNIARVNGNNIAAGYTVGDFKGNTGGPSISANLTTGLAYGFSVTNGAMLSSGGRKAFAFYAEDTRNLNAFMGNTGVGTIDPKRKLHVVPGTFDNSPIRAEGVKEYADNAAALAAGLAVGDVYRTGDVLKIVH